MTSRSDRTNPATYSIRDALNAVTKLFGYHPNTVTEYHRVAAASTTPSGKSNMASHSANLRLNRAPAPATIETRLRTINGMGVGL